MTALDTLGYAAALCTTLSFVPQAIRVYRTRSAADISATMYTLFIAGLVLWIGYGLALRAWPIVIANTVTVLLAGWILAMKASLARRKAGP